MADAEDWGEAPLPDVESEDITELVQRAMVSPRMNATDLNGVVLTRLVLVAEGALPDGRRIAWPLAVDAGGHVLNSWDAAGLLWIGFKKLTREA